MLKVSAGWSIIVVVTLSVAGAALPGAAVAQVGRSITGIPDGIALTAVIEASPHDGFNFPYLLRFPIAIQSEARVRLVVEANNSGMTSDDYGVHLKAARRGTERGVGAFVAGDLDFPLLIPAFPRPRADALVYTHALDDDSLDIAAGPLERLDMQLLAMVDDALARIRDIGIEIEDDIVITGFSASATFANRFSMIHPGRVAALAVGGFSGLLMLPVEQLGVTRLPYPLGLADFETRFGAAFDRDRWQAIPQFAFMGRDDRNDAVPFGDAYTAEHRRRVYAAVGEPISERWQRVQAVYRESGADLDGRTYVGVGHRIGREVGEDVVDFMRRVLNVPED